MSAVNDIIMNSVSDKDALEKLAEHIMRSLRASTFILDMDGNTVSASVIENKPHFDTDSIKKINKSLLKTKKICTLELFDMNCLIIPLAAISQRFGTVFVYSHTAIYEEKMLVSLVNAFDAVTLLMRCINVSRSVNDLKNEETVRAALGSLSFSELNGAISVFEFLDGKSEGIIIAGNIAKQCGITRSVIVNALKKLESASVLEIQSLGMKGTHINIINPYIYKQIKQYEKLP